MAPEQIEGQPATPRTDVYALGVVLYALEARLAHAQLELAREPGERSRERLQALAREARAAGLVRLAALAEAPG